eukprot:jgi/Psemu1/37860/gm1.37860_g
MGFFGVGFELELESDTRYEKQFSDKDNEGNVSITDLFPSFDQALSTFLHKSFDVPKESNSILCEALITSQYKTWSDFLFIENIDDLAYQDRGTRTPLLRHVQLNLQRFIDFGRHLTEQGLGWEELDHYTKRAFKDYCQGIIKARRDSAADAGAYESWIRKSRDETTFPVLQNDARFKHWLVKFKAKLETPDIDTHTFLDPNWPNIPLTGYTKALHDKQCAFFWTLALHVFQSDLSSSCVLSHTTTKDGRQAFFDFVMLYDKSKSKVYDTFIVMQHLLDIDLKSWKDTKVKFITQWFAQLEHLNKLRDPQRPLDYDTVKTHLCKACSSSFQLSEQFCKVSDPPAAQDMIRFRQHEAIAITSLQQPSSRASVKAHVHDLSSMTQSTYSAMTDDITSYLPPIEFNGNYQDYAVYKAGSRPDPSTRLPSAVWETLTALNPEHRNKRTGLFTDDGFIAWRKAKDDSPIPKSFGDSPSYRQASQPASKPQSYTSPSLPQPSLPNFLYFKVPNTPSYAPSPIPANYGEILDGPPTYHIFSKNPAGVPVTEADFGPLELAYCDVSEATPPPTNPATPSVGPSEDRLETNKDFIKFKCKHTNDELEDIIAYNDVMKCIHRDVTQEDGKLWSFRRILGHQGPLDNKHPQYKGSKYNLWIEWEIWNAHMSHYPM